MEYNYSLKICIICTSTESRIFHCQFLSDISQESVEDHRMWSSKEFDLVHPMVDVQLVSGWAEVMCF